jgi:hypothetical protein
LFLTASGQALASTDFRLLVPRAEVMPKLNASPRDPAWEKAAVISGLTISSDGENSDAAPAPTPTRVLVLWSPGALFVRFVCTDRELYVPHEGRDAALYEGDVVEVFLDPVGDHRQWYEIEVSPENDVLDLNTVMSGPPKSLSNKMLTGEAMREWWPDRSFTVEGLKTAVRRTKEGWIADLAIPASAILRRTGGDKITPRALRANFIRYDFSTPSGKPEMLPLNWSPVNTGCPHISPTAMGELMLEGRARKPD